MREMEGEERRAEVTEVEGAVVAGEGEESLLLWGGEDEEELIFFLLFKKGILVFFNGSLAKINHFYCSLAKMRPKIVCWPN